MAMERVIMEGILRRLKHCREDGMAAGPTWAFARRCACRSCRAFVQSCGAEISSGDREEVARLIAMLEREIGQGILSTLCLAQHF